MPDRAKGWIRKGLLFLGLPILVYILSTLDFAEIRKALAQSDLGYISLGLGIVTLTQLPRALRSWWLMTGQGIMIPRRLGMHAYFQSAFWGLVSPGRVGELSKVVYLDGHATSGKSIGNVLTERLVDLMCILLITFIASSFVGGTIAESFAWFAGGCFLAGCLGFAWIDLSRILARRIPQLEKLSNALQKFAGVNGKARIFVLSFLVWVTYYVGMSLIAIGVGVEKPLTFLIFSICVANLASLIPISVAGIGTRDAALVGLFHEFGIAGELALVLSSLFLVAYATQIGFLYLVAFMTRDVKTAKDGISGR